MINNELARIYVHCYRWYHEAFINLISSHHDIIQFHMTTSRSKSFQTNFWPLALLNYFIHGTHPPSSKKFSIILHDVAATTLTVAMTRVPTLLACMLVATTWSDERANPSFARQNGSLNDVFTNFFVWLSCEGHLHVGGALYFILLASFPFLSY